jgi:hypothetical protein
MRSRFAAVAAVIVVALFLSACSGSDNCASEQENCASAYLQANGLTGCCEGLTCQDSPVTPGARVCR